MCENDFLESAYNGKNCSKTKVNKEGASAQLQNWQRKSQLKSDFVFF